MFSRPTMLCDTVVLDYRGTSFSAMAVPCVVMRPVLTPRMMEIMVVVYGGGRLTDKMQRLYIKCFEIRPRVVVYRWMRCIRPIAVCHDASCADVGINVATVFSDLRNMHEVVRADGYGLLWSVHPNLIIFPVHVQTTEGMWNARSCECTDLFV